MCFPLLGLSFGSAEAFFFIQLALSTCNAVIRGTWRMIDQLKFNDFASIEPAILDA
jgi:hypothetical protein